MKLIFIVSEKFIRLDDESFLNIKEDLSWVPSNVHAVIWNDDAGYIEYKNAPKETIEELTIEINRYLSNGATLNGGISIAVTSHNHYIVSQAITITRYHPPDGDEEC